MLTATYNTPSSQWTDAIDAALAKWSQYVVGDANFNVWVIPDISESNPGQLAYESSWNTYVGTMADGSPLYMNNAQAYLQGDTIPEENGGTWHFTIGVNPNFNWAFTDGPVNGRYNAISVMTHEVGHALFANPNPIGLTMFDLWQANNPRLAHSDGSHTKYSGIMMPHSFPGTASTIREADVKIAGLSGLPTIGDDLIPIHGDVIDAGSGTDTAVWLLSFDDFGENRYLLENPDVAAGVQAGGFSSGYQHYSRHGQAEGREWFASDLINFETLQLAGQTDLTPTQQEVYAFYEVAFGRDPHIEEMLAWTTAPSSTADKALTFASSSEFTALYDSRGELVDAMYENTLYRDPSQVEYDQWVNVDASDAQILTAFVGLYNHNAGYTFSV